MELSKDGSSELSVSELVAAGEETPAPLHSLRVFVQRLTHVLTRWGVETNG